MLKDSYTLFIINLLLIPNNAIINRKEEHIFLHYNV